MVKKTRSLNRAERNDVMCVGEAGVGEESC